MQPQIWSPNPQLRPVQQRPRVMRWSYLCDIPRCAPEDIAVHVSCGQPATCTGVSGDIVQELWPLVACELPLCRTSARGPRIADIFAQRFCNISVWHHIYAYFCIFRVCICLLSTKSSRGHGSSFRCAGARHTWWNGEMRYPMFSPVACACVLELSIYVVFVVMLCTCVEHIMNATDGVGRRLNKLH
ncbi:hypothetical protein TRVL_10146 [Trypanosoma vivax]|nr:hypothetical protein TRVL_10146 [Trypanosoma vivax]